MCVIIIKQKDKTLPKGVAKKSSKVNPHGLGVIWLDTFEVEHYESKDYKVLETRRPFIAHFRFATIGKVGKENTHPFRCGRNKSEWLMMNGTIAGLGNESVCDSRVLANQLGEKPRHTWKSELEKHACRFVTINTNSRTFQIYNKELWTELDGVWYSKDNVLPSGEHVIAVYGTLKKGFSNYWSYLSKSEYIGSGITKDRYPMIVKGIPYMIEEKGKGHNVDVDIFVVDNNTLTRLDMLEGHPVWYKRKKIPIVIEGFEVMCWLYFNIKEKSAGQVFHKTYVQNNKPAWFGDDYYAYRYTTKKTPLRMTDIVDEYEEQDMFDIKNEAPICVDCFNDLEHDGFSNYHCKSCLGWFTEKEVLRQKI